ncbi:replication restart helicase PriA [Gynurincola endophyticus]|uniref:replication restart helicase PriA n=1 Tax=Gynurincola endophyticus TaxID=2479004 RepID=UPI001F1C37B4|nr:primosomal protein N' [Gynurincola endophyticus]
MFEKLFAEIIIPLALPKNYTWSVPDTLQDKVQVGVRVEVVLGKNKKYAGIVKAIHSSAPEAYDTKDIINVLDDAPIVNAEQLKLWEWIARYYMCSEGEVMAAALPAHFKLSSETILVYNEEFGEDFQALDHDEYLVAEALLLRKELKITEVQQILETNHIYPVVKRLIEKRVCTVWEALKETFTPKKVSFVKLSPVYRNEESLSKLLNEDPKLQRAEKQLELLLSYLHLEQTEGIVRKSDLLKKSNASDAQLKGLVQKGILTVEKQVIDRIQYLAEDINVDTDLTQAQNDAYEQLLSNFAIKDVCLLHGVTASGKTLLYIKLIEQYIREGKQVLYLLPEIALTSQVIRRLQKHFGGHIGIYHSKFSQNERVEIWKKIKQGKLKVVVGARSALFLPFNNIGLIVVDEEHDSSYKQQDPAPRYNARDSAIFLAGLFNAKVLLGSATPSVESYYNGQQGKYGLVSLLERFGGVEMPVIQIVDTKKIAQPDHEKVIITPALEEAMHLSLTNQKQIILFQNRRGYNPYQICQQCGWIPKCKHCDVSLTFHKITHKLHCHYCGTVYAPIHECSACGSHHFLKRSFGTEKIEEHLATLFPDAKIARMDVDSVRGKSAHDQLIFQFENKEIDILVGTQMVVKGLDFENVNLVGILDADSLLTFVDFRVNERAFQLMEQVSGRAGRRDGKGLVLVQVAQVHHPVLQFVQSHQYLAFYDFEMQMRNAFGYPPFSRVINITFKHKQKEIVDKAANLMARALHPLFGKYIIGPSAPVVSRIRNQYLMEMMVKIPRDARLLNECKHLIQQQVAMIHQEKELKSVVIIPDVDKY